MKNYFEKKLFQKDILFYKKMINDYNILKEKINDRTLSDESKDVMIIQLKILKIDIYTFGIYLEKYKKFMSNLIPIGVDNNLFYTRNILDVNEYIPPSKNEILKHIKHKYEKFVEEFEKIEIKNRNLKKINLKNTYNNTIKNKINLKIQQLKDQTIQSINDLINDYNFDIYNFNSFGFELKNMILCASRITEERIRKFNYSYISVNLYNNFFEVLNLLEYITIQVENNFDGFVWTFRLEIKNLPYKEVIILNEYLNQKLFLKLI